MSRIHREAILYYASVDSNDPKKYAIPTEQTVRDLVELGHVVMISAPYPYAPSHAHLTETGRAIAACGTHCLNGLQCVKDYGSCICLCAGCSP
jgi:hypothetical protein